jgi:hypothetical protein
MQEFAAMLAVVRQNMNDTFDTIFEGTPPVWIDVTTFDHGWNGSNVAYVKIFGIMYFRGSINGGSMNNSAFTLPVGFLPSQDRTFACVGNAGDVPPTMTPVAVNGDGTVVPISGSSAQVHLASITYPAEA